MTGTGYVLVQVRGAAGRFGPPLQIQVLVLRFSHLSFIQKTFKKKSNNFKKTKVYKPVPNLFQKG